MSTEASATPDMAETADLLQEAGYRSCSLTAYIQERHCQFNFPLKEWAVSRLYPIKKAIGL